MADREEPLRVVAHVYHGRSPVAVTGEDPIWRHIGEPRGLNPPNRLLGGRLCKGRRLTEVLWEWGWRSLVTPTVPVKIVRQLLKRGKPVQFQEPWSENTRSRLAVNSVTSRGGKAENAC
jgi:hypothetical protein